MKKIKILPILVNAVHRAKTLPTLGKQSFLDLTVSTQLHFSLLLIHPGRHVTCRRATACIRDVKGKLVKLQFIRSSVDQAPIRKKKQLAYVWS